MSPSIIEPSRLQTSGQTIVPSSQVVRSDEVAPIGGPHARTGASTGESMVRGGRSSDGDPSSKFEQSRKGGASQSFVGRKLDSIDSANIPECDAAVEQQNKGKHDAPRVELIREGDIVTAIDLTCTCGETIRLWCSYESETKVN